MTMKLLFRIIGVVIILVILVAGGMVIYIKGFLPDLGDAPQISIDYSPENIEKGRYLANEVMGCVGCHAQRDYSLFAGPIIEETKGSGGELWDETLGFPGRMYAPNITPKALGDWTDGEIFRAITAGVDKNGDALFPIMPYHQYGKLPKEDIYAVIAYMRQLKPSDASYPDRQLDFPLNFIVNFMPKEATHHLYYDSDDIIKRGEYMITAAACYDCHTPMEKGQFIEEMEYAGGAEFPLKSGGVVRASNLTPDNETGLGNWTSEQFVQRFKMYADSSFVATKVPHNEFNTFMPWEYYANIKEEDLEAMFAYLKSLEPIYNPVVKFTKE